MLRSPPGSGDEVSVSHLKPVLARTLRYPIPDWTGVRRHGPILRGEGVGPTWSSAHGPPAPSQLLRPDDRGLRMTPLEFTLTRYRDYAPLAGWLPKGCQALSVLIYLFVVHQSDASPLPRWHLEPRARGAPREAPSHPPMELLSSRNVRVPLTAQHPHDKGASVAPLSEATIASR